MIRFPRRAAAALVPALIVALGILACGPDAPTGPAGSPLSRRVSSEPPGQLKDPPGQLNGAPPGQLVACTKREHQFGSALIGPNGGTLVVGNNYLMVPPGALTEETFITGEVQEGTTQIIHFEPTGLTFKKPAGLIMDAEGCDIPTFVPDVVYVDDDGVILESIPAIYHRWWNLVAAPITHFSGYAIAT